MRVASLHVFMFVMESQYHSMAWVGRDLKEHLIPASIASISGSPLGAVLTRAFLSLYHKTAKSSDMWAHWCDSEKEGGYTDAVLEVCL